MHRISLHKLTNRKHRHFQYEMILILCPSFHVYRGLTDSLKAIISRKNTANPLFDPATNKKQNNDCHMHNFLKSFLQHNSDQSQKINFYMSMLHTDMTNHV